MDELYGEKRNDLREALSELGRRIDSGDDSNLFVWVIPGNLACAHRPLRHHPNPAFRGSRRDLPATATREVLRWMERVREAEFRSILCLMHPMEVDHYRALDLGAPDLLEFYRKHGMSVLHIPWDDPAHRSTEERRGFAEELARVQAEALAGFDTLAKPVVV